jgi:hypothetical protein
VLDCSQKKGNVLFESKFSLQKNLICRHEIVQCTKKMVALIVRFTTYSTLNMQQKENN